MYLSAPKRASMNEPSSSKSSQMPSGRRRASNGHVVILRTPTLLVRSKVSNTPSKILARYSIIHFNYWMKGRKGRDRVHEIDAYALVYSIPYRPGRVTQWKMGWVCGHLVGGRMSATRWSFWPLIKLLLD